VSTPQIFEIESLGKTRHPKTERIALEHRYNNMLCKFLMIIQTFRNIFSLTYLDAGLLA
jgi:hypothetical protein